MVLALLTGSEAHHLLLFSGNSLQRWRQPQYTLVVQWHLLLHLFNRSLTCNCLGGRFPSGSTSTSLSLRDPPVMEQGLQQHAREYPLHSGSALEWEEVVIQREVVTRRVQRELRRNTLAQHAMLLIGRLRGIRVRILHRRWMILLEALVLLSKFEAQSLSHSAPGHLSQPLNQIRRCCMDERHHLAARIEVAT